MSKSKKDEGSSKHEKHNIQNICFFLVIGFIPFILSFSIFQVSFHPLYSPSSQPSNTHPTPPYTLPLSLSLWSGQMTTSLPSTQPCEVCHSSGTNFCGHDCTYRCITCVPHISGAHVNQTISSSPTRHATTSTLHEFQFFQQDEALPWVLNDHVRDGGGLGQKEMASVALPTNCPDRLCYNFNIFSSSNCSEGSPTGSPVELSFMGLSGSGATPVSHLSVAYVLIVDNISSQ